MVEYKSSLERKAMDTEGVIGVWTWYVRCYRMCEYKEEESKKALTFFRMKSWASWEHEENQRECHVVER